MDVSGPENHDYGKREGTHTDRDGNLIRFGSPLRWPMSRGPSTDPLPPWVANEAGT